MIRVSALLRLDANKTLDALERTMRVARPSIEALPKAKRIAFARGFQRALGVTDADLQPL